MTILKVNRSICRTYINLREFTCGCDTQNVRHTDVSIIMRRAGLGQLVCNEGFASVGCGAFIGPIKRFIRVNGPGIKYVGFDTDAEGRIGFLWDSKFLEGPPGRWNGELFVCGKSVGMIQFQLGSLFVLGDNKCVENDVCPPPSACPPTCN